MLASAEEVLSVSSLDLSVIGGRVFSGSEGQKETVVLVQSSPALVQGSQISEVPQDFQPSQLHPFDDEQMVTAVHIHKSFANHVLPAFSLETVSQPKWVHGQRVQHHG